MGWRQPVIWVEDERNTRALAKASDLFLSHQWKAFLLGNRKYGRKPAWDPVQPLRGFPPDASSPVRRDFEQWRRAVADGDVTYYSLPELRGVDLDEPFSLPDPEAVEAFEDTFEYGVDYVVAVDGDEYRPYHRHVDPSAVCEAAERDDGVAVTVYREDGDYYTPESYDYWRTEGRDLDPDDRTRLSGRLDATPVKRRRHAGRWDEFLTYLEDLRERRSIEADHLRVVIWSEA